MIVAVLVDDPQPAVVHARRRTECRRGRVCGRAHSRPRCSGRVRPTPPGVWGGGWPAAARGVAHADQGLVGFWCAGELDAEGFAGIGEPAVVGHPDVQGS